MTWPASPVPPGRAFEAVGDGGPRDMVTADPPGSVTEPGLRATRDPSFFGPGLPQSIRTGEPFPHSLRKAQKRARSGISRSRKCLFLNPVIELSGWPSANRDGRPMLSDMDSRELYRGTPISLGFGGLTAFQNRDSFTLGEQEHHVPRCGSAHPPQDLQQRRTTGHPTRFAP